ncbi:hypothetical protein ABZ154_17420 [Streptomyces sp. NPDC006261]|uniref:hypothetical protein n=1 Tax=Streptomyces sp. NPDC006261 TaxID=3156739 RepID=UPI0033BC58AA
MRCSATWGPELRTRVPVGAAPPGSPAVSTPQAKRIPTTAEIDAARKPGDAATWIVDDETDLPGGRHNVHDL